MTQIILAVFERRVREMTRIGGDSDKPVVCQGPTVHSGRTLGVGKEGGNISEVRGGGGDLAPPPSRKREREERKREREQRSKRGDSAPPSRKRERKEKER